MYFKAYLLTSDWSRAQPCTSTNPAKVELMNKGQDGSLGLLGYLRREF